MLKGFSLLIVGTLLSKGVGVVREICFAAFFGTSPTAAAFQISNTAFLMPSHAIVGDTLSGGMIPLYKKFQAENSEHAIALIIISIMHALGIGIALAAILGLAPSQVVELIAPGVDTATAELATSMVLILAAATPFYIAGNLLSYVEAAHGYFGAVSLRPILINTGSTLAAVAAVIAQIPAYLAFGILLSHIIFFCWASMKVHSLGFTPNQFPRDFQVYKRVTVEFWWNAFPLMALPFIAQSGVLVERVVSSWLGTSLIPALGYARFVSETTLTLTAIPLGILTLTVHGGSNTKEALDSVRAITSRLCLVGFPISAFVSLNASEIVDVLFRRGAFTDSDTAATAAILTGLGAGLAPLIVSYYLIKALTAQMRNLAALGTTVAGVGVSVAFNIAFWRYLGPTTLGLAGALQGIVMFMIATSILRQWKAQAGILMCLLTGCLLQWAIQMYLPDHASALYRLLQAGIIWTALWGTLFLVLPPLNSIMMPVLRTIVGRVRIGN